MEAKNSEMYSHAKAMSMSELETTIIMGQSGLVGMDLRHHLLRHPQA